MKKSKETKIDCPVCGKTMVEEYEICPVCSWENDPVQLWKPQLEGGANQMSLEQAKVAYAMGKEVK
ncbi:MAG: hypothetical protein MSB08_03665 [Subdoligranulum sp.]|nr:hypothetical protein [Subdoligranulum sp.]